MWFASRVYVSLLTSLAVDPDPLAPHFPTKFTSSPGLVEDVSVQQPSLKPDPSLLGENSCPDSEDFATEMYEWLSLVRLQSPRVAQGDIIDPYLSRYQVSGGQDIPQAAKVCKISWEGFFPAVVARELLVDTIVALPSKTWFAMSVSTFASSKGLAGDGTECTIMRPPKAAGEYMLWEVKSHE